MIYLLKSLNHNFGYCLMERTDEVEIFYSNGCWLKKPPNSFTDPEHYSFELKNGKPINWWLLQYSDHADGEIVVRRKTREGYLKWCAKHPELFI